MNRATPGTGWARNPDGSLGYTWNPITGCLNHVNGLCKGGGFPCYAYRLAHGRLKQRYLANQCVAVAASTTVKEKGRFETEPFYPRFWPGRLAEMLWQQGTKPKGIFLCDMSDLFGIGIPEGWQHRIFSAIRCNPQHRFYLLTKQPQNLLQWSPFPDNCYVGVTVTNNDAYYPLMFNRDSMLRRVKARMKYISFEPLLGRVHAGAVAQAMADDFHAAGVGWVIIGAQTKPIVLPKIEWVQEIVEAADKAGIPVHLKDNLLELVNYHSPETEFAFNKDGSYRQEMPEEVKQCKGS